ncbi:MAG: alcohol dehydrogenase [Pirellulales bacterium]
MATMRVAQISRANGPFELVERPIPEPGAGWVRIKVQACGVCHSDTAVAHGLMPVQYPRVPGHEVAGVIDALGPGVSEWAVGDRVGAGWHGGYCGVCPACRQGEFFACHTGQITGISFDGGYGEYMLAPITAIARIPVDLSPADAAPLLCAGITTFNALRNSGARHGQVVGILGLGGLGHLGVQFAKRMGYYTVAIARGQDKAPLAKQLGADLYLDSKSQDVPAELQKLGGASAILATVTHGPAMTAVISGLAINGTLMMIGLTPSMEAEPITLLNGRRSIKGWYSGTAIDSEDTLAFSAHTGVRSMNELYPLERVNDAFQRMLSGEARFRAVLTMGG